MRGDQHVEHDRQGSRSFNPRPGFSCGATRRLPCASPCNTCFNPRPAFSCGATDGADRTWYFSWCFNPRPAFSCGATIFEGDGNVLHRKVSIRAPHSHAGRRPRSPTSYATSAFQSAPRILMRGDSRTSDGQSVNGPFQSAPRILMRGDTTRFRPT